MPNELIQPGSAALCFTLGSPLPCVERPGYPESAALCGASEWQRCVERVSGGCGASIHHPKHNVRWVQGMCVRRAQGACVHTVPRAHVSTLCHGRTATDCSPITRARQ